MRRTGLSLILSSAIALHLNTAQAALTLDTTFDTDGIANVDFASNLDGARDVAVQADQKLVLVGMSRQGGGTTYDHLALARLNTDGSVDATFGTAGVVTLLPVGTTAFGGVDGRTVAMQSDGKIVVAGSYNDNTGAGWRLLVGRYLSNGTLDSTFGTAGVMILSSASVQSWAEDVAIQTDGRILLAGRAQPSGAGSSGKIWRLNADGSIDTTFATSGVYTSAGSEFKAVKVLNSGAILAGGTDTNLLLVQLTSGGVPDASFDSDGAVSINISTYSSAGFTFNTEDWIEGLAVLADGKIAVGGSYRPNGMGNVFRTVTARFTAAGALDTTFGASGFVTFPTAVSDKYVYDIVALSSGELVIAGLSFNPVQISADGSATATMLGSTGMQAALGLAVQADGKVIAAGEAAVGGFNYQMRALRIGATTLVGGPPVDTTPDAFSFVDQTNVALSSQLISAPVTITGITAAASITITGGEYSVGCGATFITTAGTITNGQTVCVRHTSSASNSTAINTTLTIGGVADTFTSTTLAAVVPDTTPDAFTLVDQTNVAVATTVVSAAIAVSGINAASAVTISGGEYSIGCSATFTSAAGTISNGQSVCVRHTSSASNSTATNTTLVIGGVSDVFTSTTAAAAPAPAPAPAPSSGGGGAMDWLFGLGLLGIARVRAYRR